MKEILIDSCEKCPHNDWNVCFIQNMKVPANGIPAWCTLQDVDPIDAPITGRELMNYARISSAYEEDDPGLFNQFKLDDEIEVVDGMVTLSKHKGLGIAIEPLIVQTDKQQATARIQLRRVRLTPGDTWDEMEL